MLLDIILCAILLACGFWGLRKGLVRTFLEFVGYFFALAASGALGGLIADMICAMITGGRQVSQIEYAFIRVIGTVLLFVGIQFLVYVCARALDAVFHLPLLHQVNQLLGGAFGLLKGVLLIFIICTLLHTASFFLPSETQRQLLRQLESSSGICRYIGGHNPVYKLLGINFG